MIQRIIRKIYSILKPPQSSWGKYKNYIKVHPSVIIAPGADVKIFNPPYPPMICLEIGEGSHVFGSFNLLRPHAKIKIGKRCQIGRTNFICAESINVGDDVLLAAGITLIDTDAHALDWNYRKNDVEHCYYDYKKDPDNFIRSKNWSHIESSPIFINDRVWISMNVFVLKGVTIGENSVIGACGVVTRDVPPYSVSVGNPAKVIKILERKDI